MNNKFNFAQSDVGAYWNGSITRKEVQNELDILGPAVMELTRALQGDKETGVKGLTEIVSRLSITIAYLMYRLQVRPEEVFAWETAMQKFAEQNASGAAPQEKD